MMELKHASEAKQYYGFTVKEGFWYGIDTETNKPIATSGWEYDGYVKIYTYSEENDQWSDYWCIIEETEFLCENVPEVNTENKMSFNKWLREEKGIEWNDYDENYSSSATREIEDEYDLYYYELPLFARTKA